MPSQMFIFNYKVFKKMDLDYSFTASSVVTNFSFQLKYISF